MISLIHFAAQYVLGNKDELIYIEHCKLSMWERKNDKRPYYKTLDDDCRLSIRARRTTQPVQYDLVVEYPLRSDVKDTFSLNRDIMFAIQDETMTWTMDDKSFRCTTESPSKIPVFEKTLIECLYETVVGKKCTDLAIDVMRRAIQQHGQSKPTTMNTSFKDVVEYSLFKSELYDYELEDANANLAIYKDGPYDYWISIEKNRDDVYSRSKIEAKMNPKFTTSGQLKWNTFTDNGIAFSHMIRFKNATTYDQFKRLFVQWMYESSQKQPSTTVHDDDMKYYTQSYDDAMDVDDSASDDDGDYEEDDTEDPHAPASKHTYKTMSLGQSKDICLVSQDNVIDMYRIGRNGTSTIQFSETLDMPCNDINKMVMMDQDEKVLLLNENNVCQVDIERGKIVREWKDRAIQDVTMATKSNDANTWVGITNNAVFYMDPRVNHTNPVQESIITSSNPRYSCVATTRDGYTAVCSEKGHVRLFNKLGVRAKTELPGFGDPIVGVDVSLDGEYILVTCPTYILVYKTVIGDGQHKDALGFVKPMGEFKPTPKRLGIKPEHVQMMGGYLDFKQARFNVGPGLESTIVAATGPYVITWNFRQVKIGNLSGYSIKYFEEDVIADGFLMNTDKHMAVVLPHQVCVVDRTRLKNASTLLTKKKVQIDV